MYNPEKPYTNQIDYKYQFIDKRPINIDEHKLNGYASMNQLC